MVQTVALYQYVALYAPALVEAQSNHENTIPALLIGTWCQRGHRLPSKTNRDRQKVKKEEKDKKKNV